MLLLFALIALAFVRVWFNRVLPVVVTLDPDSPRATLWSDCTLPILLVFPFFGLAFRAGRVDLGHEGWLIVVGPIVIGAVAGGLTLALAESFRASRRWLFAALAWIATGLVILLLSAIGSLSLIVGQTLLATGAVLLWVITPIDSHPAATSPGRRDATPRIGRNTLLLFALAIGGAVIVALLPSPWATPALTLHIAMALMILIAAWRAGAAETALRAAGWMAVHGPLLGLGLLSLITLIARRTALLGSPADPAQQAEYLFNRVASSAYLFAFPAVLLILLAIAVAVAPALGRSLRLVIGAGLAVLALTAFAVLLDRTAAFP